MQINITCKHVEMTPAIKSRIEDRLAKMPRYYDSIKHVDAIIEHAQGKPTVEFIARGEHNKTFVAKETDADLYTAIDMASHKLERQLTKAKGRERDNKGGGESVGDEREI